MFKLNLNNKVRQRYKLEDQESAFQNIEIHYDAREKFIKWFDDYSVISSEAIRNTIYGEGIIILTSKQILNGLATSLAQVNQVIYLNMLNWM